MTDYSIARDYWGKPWIALEEEPLKFVPERKTPVNAEAYMRISKLSGLLDDKEGLIDYTAARALIGVVKNDAIYAQVCDLASRFRDAWKAPAGKKPLKDLVRQAKSAGGADDAAGLGIAFNGLVETVDGGATPDFIPRHLRPWIEARMAALEEFEPVLIEPFIVVDSPLKVAGNPDRYLLHKPTGIVYAADDKTGTDEPKYPLKVTIQVAIASRGNLYDQSTGKRTPIECDQDRGILIHTPIQTESPKSTLWWLDLKKGWDLALLAAKVRDERNIPKLEKIA